MTLPQALAEIRKVGSIRVENGKLKLRFPEAERGRLESAIEVLRANREAALQVYTSGGCTTSSDDPLFGGIPWAEWKAASLNRLFRDLTGRSGRITAATVRHGEQAQRKVTAA